MLQCCKMFASYLYFTAVEKHWPDTAMEWARSCHVQKDAQHGGTFDGNSCRLLLKNVDTLDRINTSLACQRFVMAFRMFNCVVQSCFGNELKPGYKEAILLFKQAYLDLNISITPKIHAIFYHIVDFCDKVHVGLGRFSEQASESVHYSFNNEWARHKVNKVHPEYNSRLLRAVNVYNCKHI